MTPNQLAQATGARIDRAQTFQPLIDAAAPDFEITTPQRMAAFLAQVGHESGGLHWLNEIWGPTPAQSRYEGRADLGNIEPGDGEKFKGHGLIQDTGRFNHAKTRDRLRAKFPDMDIPDFEIYPEKLAEPQWATLSAMDFWQSHGLNELADAGEFERITKKINGGLNGEKERLALYAAAQAALA